MNCSKKIFQCFWLIFVSAFFFTACQTTKFRENSSENDFSYIQNFCPVDIHWDELRDGIFVTDYYIPKLKVTWHCVKIDLDSDNLEIVVEPSEINLAVGKGFKLKDFVKNNKTVAAINTTPFDSKFNLTGIVKVQEKWISPSVEKYSALKIKKTDDGNFRAQIVEVQEDYEFDDWDYAVGGFFTILDGDEVFEFKNIRRSRSACGISAEGRFLYLFAATPVFSLRDTTGFSYEECAFILKRLGCKKALQFDGGHSTGLFVCDSQVEKPMFQRKISAALGIRIKE